MFNFNDLLSYVGMYYGNTDENDETEAIAQSIYDLYDHTRVSYAIKNDIDLFDLDRWEYVCNLNKTGNVKKYLSNIGFNFSQTEIDKYLSDFELFISKLVDPLYDEDYEIIELEFY